jgi:hypothetical protein
MEREIRNTDFNSQENLDLDQRETDRLKGFEAAEMADRGPKTTTSDRETPDTDAAALRGVGNTPGGEEGDEDYDDEEGSDDVDLDEDDLDEDDLEDEDLVADDDDLEVTEDDLDDDDLLLDDEDEEDEDDL